MAMSNLIALKELINSANSITKKKEIRRECGTTLRKSILYKNYTEADKDLKDNVKTFLKILWSQPGWSYRKKWYIQVKLLGSVIPLLRLFPYYSTNEKGVGTIIFREGLPHDMEFSFDTETDKVFLTRFSSTQKTENLEGFLRKGELKAREDCQIKQLANAKKADINCFYVEAYKELKDSQSQ